MNTVNPSQQAFRPEQSAPEQRPMKTFTSHRRVLLLLVMLSLTACGGGGGGGDSSATFEARLIDIEIEDSHTNQVIGASDLPVDGATITRN